MLAQVSDSPPVLQRAGVVGAAAAELGASEHGEWHYVVLDRSGLSLRKAPTYDRTAKLDGPSSRVEDGEIVKVVERIPGNGTTFLRLESPRGWAFDIQPGAEKIQRLAEVSLEYGTWFYRVCAPRGIAVRSRCSFSDKSKVGKGPEAGAVLTVSKRVRVGATMFLKPKDEMGWVFDCKNGTQMVEGPLEAYVTEAELRGSVRQSGGVDLLASPTAAKWASTKKMLVEGARVHVEVRCQAEGQSWCRVSQPGGMEGWVPTVALEFEPEPPREANQKSYDAARVRAALDAGSVWDQR